MIATYRIIHAKDFIGYEVQLFTRRGWVTLSKLVQVTKHEKIPLYEVIYCFKTPHLSLLHRNLEHSAKVALHEIKEIYKISKFVRNNENSKVRGDATTSSN